MKRTFYISIAREALRDEGALQIWNFTASTHCPSTQAFNPEYYKTFKFEVDLHVDTFPSLPTTPLEEVK